MRGDMSATDLANTIRAVKARVRVPVTYADVWEFWLRHRDVANAVDFITIHILPYWEDFPIRASATVPHVESIRRQVVAAFPGKEVLIGEVGWPSAGRMREGALPSPANQARVVQDVLALSKREKFNVNIIEAFDQPWKRALEGTVGGHWGLFDAATRAPKFAGAQAVSNHPLWIWQGAGGIVFAVIVFGAAMTRSDQGYAILALACRWRKRIRRRRPVRLDGRERSDRKSRGGRLVAFARARCCGHSCADRSERCDDVRHSCARLLSHLGPQEGPDAKSACDVCRCHSDHHNAARLRRSARFGVRPALPRFSVCATHGRGHAVSRAPYRGCATKRYACRQRKQPEPPCSHCR